MTLNEFFELFLLELKESPWMQPYYKFLGKPSSFEFRKAYFMQRLEYIQRHIQNKDSRIWDCGCGYGTTALFLAMNGYKVEGTTLEFYFDKIEKRKKYWSQFGNSDLFEVAYENLFDREKRTNTYDYIILQDTLHHIEPIPEALQLFAEQLRSGGKLLIVEVNGNCLAENLHFFLQRGWKKKIHIWDERLQKKILIGNENIRSLAHWAKRIEEAGMHVDKKDAEYIRYYFPQFYGTRKAEEIIKREQQIAQSNRCLREYFFFGIQFTATKKQ